MKRVAALLGAAFALVLAVQGGNAPSSAHAAVLDTIVLQNNICIALLAAGAPTADDANGLMFSCHQPMGSGGSGGVFHGGTVKPPNIVIIAAAASQKNRRDDKFDAPAGFEDCNDVVDAGGNPVRDDLNELLCSLDERDGDLDGNFSLRRSDFAGLDLDLNQFHDRDGRLIVVGFVDDDTRDTAFRTMGAGTWEGVAGRNYVCATSPIDQDPSVIGVQPDEDCDGDGVPGDGAVVAHLLAHQISDPGADPETRGEAAVLIAQDGAAAVETIKVVGEPDALRLQQFETSMMLGLNQDDCPLGGKASDFVEALGRPDKTIMLSKVLDDDGTEITGAFLSFDVSDPDRMIVASGLSVSLDLGSFGAGAPNIFCGAEEAGDVTLTVTLLDIAGQADLLPVAPELGAQNEEEMAEYTVVTGPAALTLTASPAQIVCDGQTSVKVSAAISDADGNPMVDGVPVDFEVSVLGTVNPMSAKTAGGVASTTVTPLAGTKTGVPVFATVGQPTIEVLEDAATDDVDNDNDGQTDEDGEKDPDEGRFLPTGKFVANPYYVQAAILVSCGAAPTGQPPAPGGTTGPGGAPGGVISGPDTGSGGSLGNVDGRGALPLWPAMALLAGAVALIGARFTLRRTP